MAEILVVDDEALMRATLRNLLEGAGHAVREAANGNEALRAVASRRPQLIIMDILMPEKEGIETILEIRRHHDSVKIVAMSGGGRVGDTEFLNIAKKIGADRSITKPFTRDQLMTALKGLV